MRLGRSPNTTNKVSPRFTKIRITKSGPYELLQRSAYIPHDSSSERELTYPKSTEKNQTLANENAKRRDNVAHSDEDKGKKSIYFSIVVYRTCFCQTYFVCIYSMCNNVSFASMFRWSQ
jgi:hypothetical protein